MGLADKGQNCDAPVGVFDSGAGGVSILRELVRELPHENFLYYGDSANAPYGEKSCDWVLARSREIVESLLAQGAKAIVVACNTATSAAARTLRAEYPQLPVIGVEPALKPAALAYPGGRILVMATPMTLKLDKFQHLEEEWGSNCTVDTVACEGLAARIEQGNLESPDMEALLLSLVGAYAGKVDCAVLGCTHYPFVSEQIKHVLGGVELFDGALGTARQTHRLLGEFGLMSQGDDPGTVSFASSGGDDSLDLYRQLFCL